MCGSENALPPHDEVPREVLQFGIGQWALERRHVVGLIRDDGAQSLHPFRVPHRFLENRAAAPPQHAVDFSRHGVEIEVVQDRVPTQTLPSNLDRLGGRVCCLDVAPYNLGTFTNRVGRDGSLGTHLLLVDSL